MPVRCGGTQLCSEHGAQCGGRTRYFCGASRRDQSAHLRHVSCDCVQAADDKIRYQKQHAQWMVEHPEEVALANAAKEDKKRGKKRSKEDGAPKRALTAYIFFTNAVREETKKEAPDAKVI